MKERFKAFLEEHFRRIAPTQSAMEYRKSLLNQLLDREQELRIKGIVDDDLIFNMAVGELGDIDSTLEEFEHRQIKNGEIKRKVSATSIIAVCAVILITLVYVLVGAIAHIWHPTWLIMVGGAFLAIAILLAYVGIFKAFTKRKFVIVRLSIVAIELLLSVFIFLLLQLVFRINGAWLTFLAMPILVLGTDTALAFGLSSKGKWIELPIFVEVLCVMLYVILGISLSVFNNVLGFWHPAWVLCLGGVVVAIVEAIVFVVVKTRKNDREEREKHNKKYVKVDEAYWTEWDD